MIGYRLARHAGNVQLQAGQGRYQQIAPPYVNDGRCPKGKGLTRNSNCGGWNTGTALVLYDAVTINSASVFWGLEVGLGGRGGCIRRAVWRCLGNIQYVC
jgi:hypothetical protein